MSSQDTVEPDPIFDRTPRDGHAAAEEHRARIAQLEEALESHAVVDQARGILMAVHRIDAEAAWGLLVRVSSHENIKVRTLAEAVIAIVTAPPPPPGRATSAALGYLLPSRSATDGTDGSV